MKQSDLEHVYSDIPQGFHDALFAAAHGVEEEQPVVRRKSWILVMAMVAVLIAGTALAAVINYYSVRQYEGEGTPSAAFEAHVVELKQTYENDYITFTLTDAIFDGHGVALAMNLDTKNPDKPVYLCPKLTAVCGDRELDLDIQGMRGDFASGFVFPSLVSDYRDGKYGFDAALYEDEADGEVTWTLKIGVFAPNWPVKNAPFPIDSEGNYVSTDSAEYQAYNQGFRDAYERKEILVTWGDSPVEYAWLGPPMPEGMTEEEYGAMRLEDMLVLSGAFTQVDTIEYTFATKLPEDYQKGIGAGLTFPLDKYTVEIDSLDVSFMRVNYSFKLLFPAGTSKEEAEALLPDGYFLDDQGFNSMRATSGWRKVEIGTDGTAIGHVEGEAVYNFDQPKEISFWPYTLAEDSMLELVDDTHAFTVPIAKDGL